MPQRMSKLPDNPIGFFRVATQRFAESQFLFEGRHHSVAIYLAGYAVECGLKALILTTVTKDKRVEFSAGFRGSGWHNLNRLVEVYIDRGGSRTPPAIARALTYVIDEWSVEMRYIAGQRPLREAERFIASTELILEWIKGRLNA